MLLLPHIKMHQPTRLFKWLYIPPLRLSLGIQHTAHILYNTSQLMLGGNIIAVLEMEQRLRLLYMILGRKFQQRRGGHNHTTPDRRFWWCDYCRRRTRKSKYNHPNNRWIYSCRYHRSGDTRRCVPLLCVA